MDGTAPLRPPVRQGLAAESAGQITGTRREPRFGGATFTLSHRLERLAWHVAWLAVIAWTPARLMPWRRLVLTAFGAKIARTAMIRSSVRIWYPRHLSVGAHASMGPGVICYNVAAITIGDEAIVSQRAHLCTGSHDVDQPSFPLVSGPITIGRRAWIAAEAFVGPGVTVGEGAVLGARGVAFGDLSDGIVHVGNPATARRPRRLG